MTRSGHRTVLVALGIAAVALGSALFPPTGLGSAPASETDLVGPDAPAPGSGNGLESGPDGSTVAGGGETVAAGNGATAGPADSGPDTDPADATATPASTAAGTTTTVPVASTPTPTSTPTATSTATAAGSIAESDDEGASTLITIVGGLTLFFVLALGLTAVGKAVEALWESGGAGGGSAQSLGLLGGIGRLLGGSPAGVAARVPQVTMVALVGVSTGTARVLGGAGSLASEAAGGLAFVLGAGSRSVTAGLGGGLTGLFSLPSGPSFSLSGLFSGMRSGDRSSRRSAESPTADARSAASVEPESDGGDPIRTVEDAWEAFADPLPADDPEARTPGEFARLAIERGDPAEAVRRLTRAFRDVRYGGRQPSDDRTRSAIEAVGDILAERDREDGR